MPEIQVQAKINITIIGPDAELTFVKSDAWGLS